MRESAGAGKVTLAAVTGEAWAAKCYSLGIAAGVVDGLDDAIAHVRRWSTGHTEAIVTKDLARTLSSERELNA